MRGLGVSHLYLSPVLQAQRGSTHGYDVVDPTRVSDDLGGEAELRALCGAGLDVIVDVVPNHMAASDENPYWRDPERRAHVFDIDPATGRHRRFFDVDELAGVRVEDPDVFETTHGKVLGLVHEGLVQGLRVDHVDGLADPSAYLERLRDAGVERVWVEKILEPGERLPAWPVEGTTGYEFANDITALFVDPAGEAPLTELYAELTGERRSFAEVAHEAKLEQVRTTFRPELDRLSRLSGLPVDELAQAIATLPVYRTYLRDAGEFVTRFQQTSGAVMAKGVEDTAFYRWNRLLALNEVGGDPSRFTLTPEAFHAGNRERAGRFPRHLLATTTHDTKRSGDVRARLAALAGMSDEWAAFARPRIGAFDDPNEGYFALQTLVGAWPLERERLDRYFEKALREAKVNTSWVDPDVAHERRVADAAAQTAADPAFVEFAERVAERGRRIALAMTLLKLTAPGVPDLYQGDDLEALLLVDPDNRRPVDWERRRGALADPPPKLRTIQAALALRARRPEAFEGAYEPVDAGDDVVAFRRGQDVLVAVPLRPDAPLPAPRAGWQDLLPDLPVALLERRHTSRP